MFDFTKKLAGTVAGFVRNVPKKAYMFATVAALAVAGASASAAESDGISLVSKSAEGAITFTPKNMADPLTDALISGYQYWAIIALIIIGAGLIVYIFKKK